MDAAAAGTPRQGLDALRESLRRAAPILAAASADDVLVREINPAAAAASSADASNALASDAIDEMMGEATPGGAAPSALQAEPPAAVVRGGVVGCPLCSRYRTRSGTRGLMRRITYSHAGRIVNDGARQLLHSLGRGMCTNVGCSAIRAFSSGACPRCRFGPPPRPLAEGDCIPCAPCADPVRTDPASASRTQVAEYVVPDGGLPDGFVERVWALRPGPSCISKVEKNGPRLA